MLNQQLKVRNLKEALEVISLKLYLMPVDQFNGIHLGLAQFVPLIPFDTAKQYTDYISRLHQVPHLIDQVIHTLEEGKRAQLMPPKYLLEKVVTQVQSIAEPAGEANVFGLPAKKFPAAIAPGDQKALHEALLAAVDTQVRPAYAKLANFIAND